MSENINLLVVESMQLAIVVLIVIVSIFNPRLTILKSRNTDNGDTFFGAFFRNYIAIGFLANFVYLVCNLGQSELAGWLKKDDWAVTAATIADICTASAFMYSSLETR